MNDGPTIKVVDDINVRIGRRAHQLLWELQMTQVEFAKRVGNTQSAITKRLRGELTWRASHLIQTAEVLHTSVAYLVGETDDPRAVHIVGATIEEHAQG